MPKIFQHRLFDRRNLPAWLTLAVCLLLTWLAWYGLRMQQTRNASQQYELHAQELIDAISDRMRQQEQILLGAAGVFDASATVSRAAWHAYVDRINLDKNYPGMQGVGFAKIIRPEELPAHIAATRAEGFPQYSVRPPGVRAIYTPVIYLEPFTGRNLAAFGYDMMSETTRAQAMKRAVDINGTTISGKVTLVQENQGKAQPGFLMYLPIYQANQPLATPDERWHALQGFVYSPFRAGDLMHGIDLMNGFMGGPLPWLNFTIYDGNVETEQALLYDSAEEERIEERATPPRWISSRTLDTYGRKWTIRVRSRPALLKSFESPLNFVIPILGGGSSLLLFTLASFLIFRRDRAEELAQQMTEEIRHNQEKLLLSEARLSEGQRIAKLGTWELNLLTGELIWTDEVYRLFEIDKSQFGATYEALLAAIHPADRDSVNQAYANSLATRAPYEIIHRLRMNDGRIKWVQEHGTSDFDADGKPLRSRGTVQDITERKIAEESLAHVSNFNRAIIAGADHLIIATETDGIIRAFNPAAEIHLGYQAEELIGKSTPAVFYDVAEVVRRAQELTADGTPVEPGFEVFVARARDNPSGDTHEWTYIRKDGSRFPVSLTVTALRDAHGEITAFLGIATDITERLKMDRMKSEFISTVSHELRTPLTSIRGALGLIAGGVAGPLPAQAKALIDIAQKNSERLILLVNDILDMEKIEAGKMDFQSSPTELMPLIRRALQDNHAYAEQYQVSYKLQSELPGAMINVDSNRLLQVLANLLSNAAKFSASGGMVAISAKHNGQRVRIEVSDNGSGIPEQFRGQIFQKFAQADSSDTRKKGGTGLGLAITKSIVEQMGGSIGFDSEPNIQTTFFIEFPAWNEIAATNTTGKKRVLICEDDHDIAALLRMMLEQAGLATDIASNAAQAKEMLHTGEYAAMTLDLGLPDQNGIALIRELRANKETATLPIVVVSARASEGRKELNGEAFSVADWLTKPIDHDLLIASLKQAVKQSSGAYARVLHVEDDPDVVRVVQTIVGDLAEVVNAPTLADARHLLESNNYNLAILDISLPDGSGMELLPILNRATPPIPVMVFSAHEMALQDMQQVRSALVKSRADNEQLLTTIKKLLGVA